MARLEPATPVDRLPVAERAALEVFGRNADLLQHLLASVGWHPLCVVRAVMTVVTVPDESTGLQLIHREPVRRVVLKRGLAVAVAPDHNEPHPPLSGEEARWGPERADCRCDMPQRTGLDR